MIDSFVYLLVNIGAVSVPFIASFHKLLRFDKLFIPYFMANFIIAFLFILWDVQFTKMGVWGFSDRYTMGVDIAGLPIEEIMFFICIPFACVFSYHCFGTFWGDRLRAYNTRLYSIIIIIFLSTMLILYWGRWYPTVTFSLTIAFIIFIEFIRKPFWLGQFYFTYAIMFIPFLITNGILTGTGLEEPVVWYNSDEIIGVRIGTIPMEDTFYGFLLVGLVIFIYELLNPKNRITAHAR